MTERVRVDSGRVFEHPLKLPSKRLRPAYSEDGPIMSPREWADFNRAPITPAVEQAECEYRATYGGGIVTCRAEYLAPACPCGSYALDWPR